MMISLISNYLFDKYKIEASSSFLQSFGDYHLTEDILNKIKEAGEYFEELLETLQIADHIFHPTGVFKYIEDYALRNGRVVYKTALKVDNEGTATKINIPHHYEPNKPDEYVIVIVDHVSLMEPENGTTLRDAMSQWSFRYARKKLTKFFKYVVVNVQQQSAESEKQQFDMRGGNITSKLLPSLTNLGDNKTTARDAFLVLGLFSPYRFQIEEHNGHDITKLKDNYRTLYVLKNRYGKSVATNLYFNGASNFFKELPRPDDLRGMNNVYKLINSN